MTGNEAKPIESERGVFKGLIDGGDRRFMIGKNVGRRRHPCCTSPRQTYHYSWKDEDGLCANCGKYLRYGSGPLDHGAWPKKGIEENKKG